MVFFLKQEKNKGTPCKCNRNINIVIKGFSIKTYEVPGEGTLIFGRPPKEAIY